MKVNFELPITDELSVKLRSDRLIDILRKSDVKTGDDINYFSYRIGDLIEKKLQEYVYSVVLTDEYKAILKSDANRRMLEDGARKRYQQPTTEQLISWCWENNAGHWPDGTPITDD